MHNACMGILHTLIGQVELTKKKLRDTKMETEIRKTGNNSAVDEYGYKTGLGAIGRVGSRSRKVGR